MACIKTVPLLVGPCRACFSHESPPKLNCRSIGIANAPRHLRSAYIATFLAHLTYELKSLLTSIKGAAELLLDSLQRKSDTLTQMEQKNFISNILGDTGRPEAMTQRLRELARRGRAAERTRRAIAGDRGLKRRFPTRAIDATGSARSACPAKKP
jgi:signal transduction histidine kinase